MSSSAAAMSPREHVERIRLERYYIGRSERNPLSEDMHYAVNYLSQEIYSKDVHFLMELVQWAPPANLTSIFFPFLPQWRRHAAAADQLMTPAARCPILRRARGTTTITSFININRSEIDRWSSDPPYPAPHGGKKLDPSIQCNAEDNEYPSGVPPSLEFLVTSKDITESGASATLLIFNNEKGFSPANIESISRVGKSTKKGNRDQGYIGEKGIGFKSVFLISSQPHIFSKGYQIKFNEKPCDECGIGYIVPEWVESRPSLSDIREIYGSSKDLPTTTIILPLKNEKVNAVKEQLSSIHPEMLLFLSKIRQLSVKEDNCNPECSTLSEISISSEKDFEVRKNVNAESYTVHLSALEDGKKKECPYYMWRQKFLVKPENRVDKRAEIGEWVITLAFPFHQRLSRGKQLLPGVYAFLPTEMVTNFPFIIQADFLLASSREAILFDSPWNKGILECVPSAFRDVFVTLVKSGDNMLPSYPPSRFKFLPVDPSLIPLLEPVRSGIKDKVLVEDIVPCESYTPQKIFCKPGVAGRLKPAFWDILSKAEQSVDLKNLSTHGTYIISSYFDMPEYNSVLEFLGIKSVNPEWYAKCIEGSNLVKEVPEPLYLEIISFIADNWENFFSVTSMPSIPLLKYVDRNDVPSFWSLSRARQYSDRLCIASENKYISWLISWNKEFPSSSRFFFPLSTQAALKEFSQKATVTKWFEDYAKVETVSVYGYAHKIVNSLGSDRRPVIAFAHFLYHSSEKEHVGSYNLSELLHAMPVIDNYGNVITVRENILVPAKGSKWVGLMGSNPWRNEMYVELSSDYKSAGCFAGQFTSEDQLMAFLNTQLQVSDVPFINPPDASFPTVSSPLTLDNAVLLLQWIRNLKSKGVQLPARFLACIKQGSWLKTSVGYKPPNESFLSSAEWGSLLQNGSSFVDIPMIDQHFYGNKLQEYKKELQAIGVRFEFREASAYIGSRLMSMAANNMLTRENVYQLLRLIRFMREKFLPPSELINSVKDGIWMKTILGYRSPAGCIMHDLDWEVASCISDQPFLDVKFYGETILSYKEELELLGVLAKFKDNYNLVIDNFKFSSTAITSEATILILKCIRHVKSCDDFVKKLRGLKWLKTNMGFHAPTESFFVDSKWECLIKVFDGIPVIDYGFYGSEISSYKEELKKTGLITKFEEASEAIANFFKQMVSKSSLKKASVLALLSSYQQLSPVPYDLFNCMRTEKWLWTSMGFKAPSDAILFNEEWQSLSPIAKLPFIDDGDTQFGLGKEIHGYKAVLKELGVIVEAKGGARFVITGINIPNDPSIMSKATVLALLECICSYLASTIALPKDFCESIASKEWLKTTIGYRRPDECILFDAKCTCICKEDGPFIDEAFYGSEIASFKDVLEKIGAIVDIKFGHDLVARHLRNHKDNATISRVYMYLMDCNWEPENKTSNWVWIPNGSDGGEWVSPLSCVLHDRDNLFASHLHVLDKYYEKKLLDFFSVVLGVRHGPGAEDYCKLWSTWESSVSELSIADCSAFWKFIAINWGQKANKLLSGCMKVPVCSDGKIILSNKKDVFIPDDLLLKDLFSKISQEPCFIWYPFSSLPSMSRASLNNIYGSIGVGTISKAVQKNDSFTLASGNLKTVGLNKVIKAGLLQLVFAFLADPVLDISTKERHRMVSWLLDVTVLETDEPITVGYSVSLSSGRTLDVKASRMLRWERENKKLYIQRSHDTTSYREKIEFATYFAEEICQGLLFEKADQIPSLAELIKLGCLLDFQYAAVEFLLKSKNLQLLPEDEAFLNAALQGLLLTN
uniref:Protein NO VEIN C-terminal domain-containing protein n=1 Tax=Leersia perrieri TaxID=77586 RepID=A0A0D9XSE1_9ORYZ